MSSASEPKFSMTVDMSVLEALGINLYSNAAAVLSELVANAWDADASEVSIRWEGTEEIVIKDDGAGMSVASLNGRFLKVGYQKRATEGACSARWKRPFMGRKGIGKLSVFSIADEVDVFSSHEGIVSGLRISVHDLRESIKAAKPYYPKEIDVPSAYSKTGTAIVLKKLRPKRADLTAAALRKRLARRFDVLDLKKPDEGGFRIVINDSPITYEDRQELKKLEFIWEFGRESIPDKALPPNIQRFVFKDTVVDATGGWKVAGWIGTAKTPTELTDDLEAGSLKNIIVLARKRPIQEGIIEKLDFSRLFGNYVTGQIEADFLDLDDHDDIATSDRQRLIEDDPRVLALQNFMRQRFLEASQQWAEARPKREAVDAIARYPKIRDWINGRPPWQRKAAERMIGTIATLEFEGTSATSDRHALFRSGILAFERVGLRQTIEDLQHLSTMKAVDLLPVLAEQDSYESALYMDILRSRLEAISSFREISHADEKEKVLQQHLYSHLWLLDASWERASQSETMEEDLRRIAPGLFSLDDEGKERTGRIDIRYATISGQHLIVELKRYARKTDIDELAKQGAKYAVTLRDLLEQQGQPNAEIEVVFVLGQKPTAKERGMLAEQQYIDQQLRTCNGRIVYYDEMITNAQKQYADYLEARDEAKRLNQVLDSLI
ncbi:ATP-binding protein [Actinosynnema sp. NPDC023587]|uniref:BbrUII/HgiDII family restriction enzyme n=1 Tax=Actinosynnema sp. NPDC023587 TaxID=3154695 RepID=UPI00340F47E9